MDLYQIATAYWEGNYKNDGTLDPREHPAYEPRPEVPVPTVPEENPPFEKEPETPPIQPDPELPPVAPSIPEVEPLTHPGGEPDIPAFS
jgi:hypothetical protein